MRKALLTFEFKTPIKYFKSFSESEKIHWPFVSKTNPLGEYLREIDPPASADHVMEFLKYKCLDGR